MNPIVRLGDDAGARLSVPPAVAGGYQSVKNELSMKKRTFWVRSVTTGRGYHRVFLSVQPREGRLGVGIMGEPTRDCNFPREICSLLADCPKSRRSHLPPKTRLPKLQTRLPKLETPLLKLQTPLLKLQTPLLKLQTPLPKLQTPLLKLQTPLPKLRTPLLKLQTRLLKLQTRLLKLQTPLLKLQTPLLKLQRGPPRFKLQLVSVPGAVATGSTRTSIFIDVLLSCRARRWEVGHLIRSEPSRF